jgi:Flp pilus assembly pilin Flp
MDVVTLVTWLRAKFGRDEGANLVEYILLVALIALLVIGAVIFMRDEVTTKFSEAGQKVSATPNP